ncbi:hypothetical protein FRX31_008543 [Thalictrum thalictroides]|uniref:Uncharacterized protein n=1 Tax=Thalictrum thalictroides TaxID=46969 RepID=A0A7J6WZG6_THATH|nr:hypothetical protein FRX31_008543 [Thalictrum thalictroides]
MAIRTTKLVKLAYATTVVSRSRTSTSLLLSSYSSVPHRHDLQDISGRRNIVNGNGFALHNPFRNYYYVHVHGVGSSSSSQVLTQQLYKNLHLSEKELKEAIHAVRGNQKVTDHIYCDVFIGK